MNSAFAPKSPALQPQLTSSRRTLPPPAPPPPPPPYNHPSRRKFQFKVKRSFKGRREATSSYQDDETEMRNLIQDVWTWIHEEAELEISIEKTRV